jgi:hypothetical protein
MRWLIVGPYPPEQGSGPASAAAAVAERLADGDTVHAISPRPSAAHAHLPLAGVRAMWALARLARREGADGLWLRVEPGILLQHSAHRRQALLERRALATLLRRFRTSVLDVGDVGLLPGGRAGRPVFAAASRFVAHTEAAAATLVANGAPAEKVVRAAESDIDAVASAPGAPPRPTSPVDYPDPIVLRGLSGTRLAIETAMRARAEQLRAARAAAAQAEPGGR